MKEVKKFLRKHPPTEVQVRGARGQNMVCFLLKGRLALLGPKKDVLYILLFVDNWNSTRFIPDKHIAFMDMLFKIEDVIDHAFEPSRFLEELTYTPEVSGDAHYKIWIDGILVYETELDSRCDKARNQFLKERKRGLITFNHLRVIDTNGNRTDFIFN